MVHLSLEAITTEDAHVALNSEAKALFTEALQFLMASSREGLMTYNLQFGSRLTTVSKTLWYTKKRVWRRMLQLLGLFRLGERKNLFFCDIVLTMDEQEESSVLKRDERKQLDRHLQESWENTRNFSMSRQSSKADRPTTSCKDFDDIGNVTPDKKDTKPMISGETSDSLLKEEYKDPSYFDLTW